MHTHAPVLNAAIRALHGESDLEAVRAAFGDRSTACVPALAGNAHPAIRTMAALFGELPSLLDPHISADPAISAAVRSLIGAWEMRDALCT